MGIYLLHEATHGEMNKSRARFFWEGVGNKRKYHMVDWATVCKPKELGGLGILNTKLMNIALMLKWIWKLYQGAEGLWVDLLQAKYLGGNDIFSPLVPTKGSQFWNAIQKIKCWRIMPPKPALSASRSGSKKRANPMYFRTTDCRLSPHLLLQIMKLIVENDQQKGYVKEIGFGSFLSMGEFEMNNALTLWLVDKFNCDSESLEFEGGISIPVRPLVKRVLGIPSGPIQVVEGLDVDDDLYYQYTCNRRAKNAMEVANEMCIITDKEPFCIAFMMAILGIYLAPDTSGAVNRALLGAVKQVDKLKDMDWCNFVATYLFKGIKEYKESNTTCVSIKGCLHILSVVFIDHAAFEVPVGFPRLGVVTTKHINWVVSHPFTSLMVCRPEESIYAAVLDIMPKDNNIVEDGKRVDSETNTDALGDKLATTNTDQNNNKDPVSAELDTAITSPSTTSSAIVEHAELGTSPRSAGTNQTLTAYNIVYSQV
ncbi:uncharacterized protein LOC124664572 [Lolium rigidum]|uniref:uncharacterized protein LOC124664572 n=1 Tax=Lolium rigidum TaxID=89674 RepID=UPI001F5CA72B|nr:uncharacterized protein LOC124664572 [Lolium rigidum]